MRRKRVKKRWSEIVNPDGGRRIRIYEQEESSLIHYSVMVDGRKIRRSLETSDRPEAVRRATGIALELAKDDTNLQPTADVSFGQIRCAYLAHRGHLLSPYPPSIHDDDPGTLRGLPGAKRTLFPNRRLRTATRRRIPGRPSLWEDPRGRPSVSEGS